MEQLTYTFDIKAGVDAADEKHALVLIALELLRVAFTGKERDVDDHRLEALPAYAGLDVPGGFCAVPGGYVGYVDFEMHCEGNVGRTQSTTAPA